MSFTQSPPVLANQYLDDRLLRSLLRRVLPAPMLSEVEPGLTDLGERVATEFYPAQLQDLAFQPTLTQFDAYGNRVDRVSLSAFWQRAHIIAARHNLIAAGYDPIHQQHARIHQFALAYLFHPSSELFSCPLAMTDGAARCLLASGNQTLIERALPKLTSRDPGNIWISGQWMTETSGGSDVSGIETIAKQDARGRWRLYGRKWFASAIIADVALVLARPEGNGAGADNLALFYVEPRKADGRLRNITIDRLKQKLGTHKLPTAEIELDGTPAELVGETRHGVRAIAPVLNVTRLWNAICATGFLRRGLALARDYATRRVVFGMPLIDQPLHQQTLADLQAELEACFHLTFYVAELLGRVEHTPSDEVAGQLLLLLTPIVKLTTAKIAVAGVSEVLESFGGAGYIEDTGLPELMRDAQVCAIWEGTTNVLALEVLKVLKRIGGLQQYLTAIRSLTAQTTLPELEGVVKNIREATAAIAEWIQKRSSQKDEINAGARGLALSLGRTLALALLARHADWSFRAEHDPRPLHAARRFARLGVLRLVEIHPSEARILASDIYA
ncbi:MAG: acyl-CoA dehydrogenase [Lysobacterales bacterium CG02_land_8_20_14_3_00_62_12]|nr:MAG: acyl-CoA dehydrogenase [Xanthomonadales bacterium CG02_land_8_20_14_3_00_62_12]